MATWGCGIAGGLFGYYPIFVSFLRLPSVLPKEITSKYKVVPIQLEDNRVTVAVGDPFDVQSIDTIRFYLEDKGYQVETVIAREDEVEAAISKFYTSADAEVEKILQDLTDSMHAEAMEKEIEEGDEMASLGDGVYEGTIPGLAATKPVQGAKVDPSTTAAINYKAHLRAVQDSVMSSSGVPRSAQVHSYTVALNGFSALMTEEQAAEMKQ